METTADVLQSLATNNESNSSSNTVSTLDLLKETVLAQPETPVEPTQASIEVPEEVEPKAEEIQEPVSQEESSGVEETKEEEEEDRKSTRLNSSHTDISRMPSSA